MNVLWLGWRDLYASRRILEESRRVGINLSLLEITELEFATVDGRLGVFDQTGDILQRFDALCVRTFHPYISESLTVAHLFKREHKIVVDESLTDEGYSVSKMHDYLLLSRSGVAVPKSIQVYSRPDVERYAEQFTYPCILKGVHGSQGLHVHRARDRSQLRRLLSRYPDGELLLQEFLDATEDFRVMVIGYEALPKLLRRHPRPGDFRTNFAVEGEGEPMDLDDFPQFRRVAEQAARTLRREFAGVDIRMRGNQPLVLEVNRRPDFDGFEEATQLNVATVFLSYVQRKFEAARTSS